MKVFVSLLAILAPAVVGVMGALVRDIPVVSESAKLLKLCQDGGANSYVGVLYQKGQSVTYNFNQCYPYQLAKDNLAKMAVFCKATTCFSNPWAFLIISKV
ncbi:hypothetical protein K443DRAFT_360555 [Laccaria amethystina LaAM-08-1]|uniref:Uncharacterized protein n=1 Tax=Laccaria amethystina LaAM-08-1 TaxID=1095629 RepID=A0A0C9YB47_9AGAR|nr:hypothetical protein K443DRAFT_360555 [Laccaria amethystina LaAM-08-1]